MKMENWVFLMNSITASNTGQLKMIWFQAYSYSQNFVSFLSWGDEPVRRCDIFQNWK